MFSDPKYSFSLCQKSFFAVLKKIIFFTIFNLLIYLRSTMTPKFLCSLNHITPRTLL